MRDSLRISVRKIHRTSRKVRLEFIRQSHEWSCYIGFCEQVADNRVSTRNLQKKKKRTFPSTGVALLLRIHLTDPRMSILYWFKNGVFSRNCVALLLRTHLTYPRMIILYWFLRGIMQVADNWVSTKSVHKNWRFPRQVWHFCLKLI